MLNRILENVPYLSAQATKGIAGLTLYSPTLNLPHSEDADLPSKLTMLTTTNTAYKETLVVMKAKRTTLANAVKNTRRFMMVVRENLKPTMGTKYSTPWTAVGFTGSLTVPRNAESLLNTLQLVQGYLTAHPIADGGPSLAAARAGVLHDGLALAISALALQKDAVNQALTLRDQKAADLEDALRTLLHELHQVLDPLDARWFAFGFLKPGQKYSPERPDKVSISLSGPDSANVKWKKAARAEYYRIWNKVVGVDEDFVSIGNAADLDFALENLPPGAAIEIMVSAVNSGGESARSEKVTVLTA